MPHSYYTLGASGLRVSRLALGTMTFGPGLAWAAEESEAEAIFNSYVDSGGNFIDTADKYTAGNSERMVGQFINNRQLRDQVVVSTKFSFNTEAGNPNAGGNGRKNLLMAVDKSLKRLNTDYIDLYFVHVWDRLTPVDEVLRTLDDLVTAGKIRHYGLSDIPAWYASRAQTMAELRGWDRPIAMQLEYSLAERSIEDEFIPLGQSCGMGTVVWSPLFSGLLSGKYKPSETGEFGSGRLQTTLQVNPQVAAKFNERNWAILAELEKAAKLLDRTVAQVAINWVANRPGVGSVILGATRLGQLTENLAALDFEIPDSIREGLDSVSASPPRFPYRMHNDPAWRGQVNGEHRVGNKPPGYLDQT